MIKKLEVENIFARKSKFFFLKKKKKFGKNNIIQMNYNE